MPNRASKQGRRNILGSIGGSSGDGGVEYRRAVAAYAVAYGLAGRSLPGFGVPMAEASVTAVVLETADAVDDLRIEFTNGWRALVQAKRRLEKGKQFDNAIAQWVRAAQEGIDPDRDRLVIVAGELSGSIGKLKALLDRFKSEVVEDLTATEESHVTYLNERLAGLDRLQREQVLRSAVIHVLEVEEPEGRDARESVLLLDKVVDDDPARAWTELVATSGKAARRRGGYTLAGWLHELRGRGVRIASKGDSPAAHLERSHLAVRAYFDLLKRRASTIDLRGLGASIPPLDTAEADCSVLVQLERDDRNSKADLLWTFLRRGRMILSGLPGSGKSTALTALAARLVEVVEDYIPVLVSLKDLDALDRAAGFEDRVLTLAVRESAQSDRPILRAELAERLHTGGIALLFDGLDETYERRGAVVAELSDFAATISPNVDILLSTRDVGYAQAATLGWPEARLVPPEDLARTIGAILRAAEASRTSEERKAQPGAQWIAARRRWIDDALTTDRKLAETPLIPVLLTLLATERADGNLPAARADILRAVVEDAVYRRESHRKDEFTIGQLSGGSAARAVMDAFSEEATAILDHRGQCVLAEALGAVSTMMSSRWGLAAGPAEVAASSAVHFWDETGIFVITGATETVSPRIMLFAEIGDAMRAVNLDSSELHDWIERRSDAGSVESVVLAAGLSPAVSAEAAAVAVSTANRDLLLGLAGALDEGAILDALARADLVSALLLDASDGDRAGWRSWRAATSVASDPAQAGELRRALKAFPDSFRAVGSGLVELKFSTVEDMRSRPDGLIAALGVQAFERLPPREPQSGPDLSDLAIDPGLVDFVVAAADVLLGHDPQATELVLAHVAHGPRILREQLDGLLRDRGFGSELDAVLSEERTRMAKSFERLIGNYDSGAHRRFIADLAARPGSPLTYLEKMRLDDLADFLETLNLNDSSSWVGKRRASRHGEVVDLIGVLGGFDTAVIAGQAQVVLDRMDHDDDHAPFFALFDGAQARELDRWDLVADRAAAVDLLLDMLTWGLGNSQVAAGALWGKEVADLAAQRLRVMVPKLAEHTEHQRLAAHVLASMVDGPEPLSWLDSDDPILRAVAAMWCDATSGEGISPYLLRLLEDPDGYVRSAAIRRLSDIAGAQRDHALSRVARGPDPGWTCLSCRTVNEAGRSVCAKPECHRAPPHPADEAQKILARPKGASP